jgi:hypothetical protein
MQRVHNLGQARAEEFMKGVMVRTAPDLAVFAVMMS